MGQSSSWKPRIRCLVAVWGAKYIKDYLTTSFPTILSNGNIPFLAEHSVLEVVFLTTRESTSVFERYEAFRVLSNLCNVKFLFIDDLIEGKNYGITLTVAYARGIADSGDNQTNTYFLFMNSDFLYSDGSLRFLYSKIISGSTCIGAPTLRVNSGPVIEYLRSCFDSATSSMALPSRVMVDIALKNLHPTVIGKLMTGARILQSISHNQLYWKVDDKTLIARHYLIFMQLIKPEKPLECINSYCDYGFIPEMTSIDEIEIITDSDDLFIIELQEFVQELNTIRQNKIDNQGIALELSKWTTREHRAVSQHDIIYHAADIPDAANKFRDVIKQTIADIEEHLAEPIPHDNHPYWVGGMDYWVDARRGALPSELQKQEKVNGFSLRRAITRAKIKFLYPSGKNYMWHPGWLDSHAYETFLKSISEDKSTRVAFIHNGSDSGLLRVAREQNATMFEFDWLLENSNVDDKPKSGVLTAFDVVVFVDPLPDKLNSLLKTDMFSNLSREFPVHVVSKVDYNTVKYNDFFSCCCQLTYKFQEREAAFWTTGGVLDGISYASRQITFGVYKYLRSMRRLTAKVVLFPFMIVAYGLYLVIPTICQSLSNAKYAWKPGQFSDRNRKIIIFSLIK